MDENGFGTRFVRFEKAQNKYSESEPLFNAAIRKVGSTFAEPKIFNAKRRRLEFENGKRRSPLYNGRPVRLIFQLSSSFLLAIVQLEANWKTKKKAKGGPL